MKYKVKTLFTPTKFLKSTLLKENEELYEDKENVFESQESFLPGRDDLSDRSFKPDNQPLDSDDDDEEEESKEEAEVINKPKKRLKYKVVGMIGTTQIKSRNRK